MGKYTIKGEEAFWYGMGVLVVISAIILVYYQSHGFSMCTKTIKENCLGDVNQFDMVSAGVLLTGILSFGFGFVIWGILLILKSILEKCGYEKELEELRNIEIEVSM